MEEVKVCSRKQERSGQDWLAKAVKSWDQTQDFKDKKQEHSESAELHQGSSIPGLSSKFTLKLSGYNFL